MEVVVYVDIIVLRVLLIFLGVISQFGVQDTARCLCIYPFNVSFRLPKKIIYKDRPFNCSKAGRPGSKWIVVTSIHPTDDVKVFLTSVSFLKVFLEFSGAAWMEHGGSC